MRSAARLTSDVPHDGLFAREAATRGTLGASVDKLESLVEVYRALLRPRARRGALDFDAPESTFNVGEQEQVRVIEFKSRNEAHKLIEECMVLANVAVAKELQRLHVPALHRVHPPPEQRKLDNLKATLAVLGIGLQIPAELSTRDLAQIAPRVRDAQLRPFIETLVVRSLSQALYQPENIGHFGLALADYTHFTSPIRRYPDLLVHRALRAGSGLAARDSTPDKSALEAVGADLSRLEKRADEADRYVDSFLKCGYLRDRIGQCFQGLITTLVEVRCFLLLLSVDVDGLLHLTALNDYAYP